ncbi:uncharacterized protein LOC115949320, partial [Geospiza fortis]|uniref:Uncharacterized protein LOC115949320 n=1 Tax=Geospiza fortis TaxID=48883 RepID=A0A8N5I5G6_GEOFO
MVWWPSRAAKTLSYFTLVAMVATVSPCPQLSYHGDHGVVTSRTLGPPRGGEAGADAVPVGDRRPRPEGARLHLPTPSSHHPTIPSHHPTIPQSHKSHKSHILIIPKFPQFPQSHHVHSQVEKLARTLFLWEIDVHDQKERVSEMRRWNEALVANMLPEHVARHFLGSKKRDEISLPGIGSIPVAAKEFWEFPGNPVKIPSVLDPRIPE